MQPPKRWMVVGAAALFLVGLVMAVIAVASPMLTSPADSDLGGPVTVQSATVEGTTTQDRTTPPLAPQSTSPSESDGARPAPPPPAEDVDDDEDDADDFDDDD